MLQIKSLNSVSLIGRLGKDAELRSTKSGTQFATFGLATEMKFKSAEESVTTWHNCTLGGASVAKITPMLVKGALVSVRGYLRYRKDGEKMFTDICVEDLTVLSTPKSASATHSESAPQAQDETDEGMPF
jgi:single-strand DNA-binding protein